MSNVRSIYFGVAKPIPKTLLLMSPNCPNADTQPKDTSFVKLLKLQTKVASYNLSSPLVISTSAACSTKREIFCIVNVLGIFAFNPRSHFSN